MKDIQINLAVAGLVVGLLNAIGSLLKAVPWVRNHYIPFVLGVGGGIAYPAIEGWTALNVVIGIGLAVGSTGLHQWVQQGASVVKQEPPRTNLLIWCLLPWFVFAGCSTTTGGREITPAKVERSIDAAVGIFATIQLREKPQSRPKLEAARAGLNALVSQERWDLAAFGEALAATGASEISGSDIVLIVETSVTLIDVVTGGTIDVSQVEYARAVILGGQKALNRVLTR